MPDLGKYTFAVLGAYGVTFTIILFILFISLHKAKQAKNTLKKLDEKRTNKIDKNT